MISNPIYAKPFGHYSIGTSRSNFFRQVKMHDLLKIIYQRPIDEKISKKLFKQRLARKVVPYLLKKSSILLNNTQVTHNIYFLKITDAFNLKYSNSKPVHYPISNQLYHAKNNRIGNQSRMKY